MILNHNVRTAILRGAMAQFDNRLKNMEKIEHGIGLRLYEAAFSKDARMAAQKMAKFYGWVRLTRNFTFQIDERAEYFTLAKDVPAPAGFSQPYYCAKRFTKKDDGALFEEAHKFINDRSALKDEMK